MGLAQRPLRPGFLIQPEPAEPEPGLFILGRKAGGGGWGGGVKPFQKIIIIKTLI